MAEEARKTGMTDRNYDLISAVYHALQGAETVGMYIEDAEREGDSELADFFRNIQGEYRSMADEGKRLISRRFGSVT